MADDSISVKVEGLAELQAKLDALTQKQADRCIRTALKAGAVIEHAAIVERAPVKEIPEGWLPVGAVKNDIIIRFLRDKTDGAISAKVGPGKLTAHVARWVEYGHRIVQGGRNYIRNGKQRGNGKVTGEVEAHPFIRTAYEETRQQVISTICDTLAAELTKASKTKGTT